MKVESGSVAGCDVGYRVPLNEEETERINLHVLRHTSGPEDDESHFIVPQEQRIELFFFRQIFTRLREQVHMHNVGEDASQDDESIPIEEFQRAFERLFHVLKDPQGFDASVYDRNRNGFVGWSEFCIVYKKRQMVIRLSALERIFLTFDDPDASYLSTIVSWAVLLTIVVSSMCFILSTVPEKFCQIEPSDGSEPKPRDFFKTIERICLWLFIAEYLIRFLTCWGVRAEVFNKSKLLEITVRFDTIRLPKPPWWLPTPFDLPAPVIRILKFVFGPANLLDFFAILPGIMGMISSSLVGGGGFVVLRLIRLTRVFRTINSIKRPSIVIARTMTQSAKALYVLAFNLGLGIVISGSLMYLAEGGKWDEESRSYLREVGRSWNHTSKEYVVTLEESPFPSIPHAFWWAIVTATTVGYGDHYPTTSLGKIVAVGTMLFSLVILALPIGVIGENFMFQWEAFEEDKARAQSVREAEMHSITSAIQRIEPERMTKMLVVEVWNDRIPSEMQQAWGARHNHCSAMARPLPAEFLGSVDVHLELPPDVPVTRQETHHLRPDPHIVERHVSGTITFEYEWTPRQFTKFADEAQDPDVDPQLFLLGTLKVTLIRCDNLLNVDLKNTHSASNPFVTFTCYPRAPRQANELVWPVMWQSPTRQNSLNPKWQGSHNFDFDWTHLKVAGLDDTQTGPPKASDIEEINSMAAPMITKAPSKDFPDSKLDAAFELLHELGQSVGMACEEMQVLTGRVDRLTASTAKMSKT
mmetsp:Transcript_94777/g.210716  ORF Transcript_94777/g.210716 Transcript_94777/m.210716 type:complete len:755 (-) Transcript_94777:222-2486(-)